MLENYRKNIMRWRLPPALERQYLDANMKLVGKAGRLGSVIVSIVLWVGFIAGTLHYGGGQGTLSLLWLALGLQALMGFMFVSTMLPEPARTFFINISPISIAAIVVGFLYSAILILPFENITGTHTTLLCAILISYMFEKQSPFRALAGAALSTICYFVISTGMSFPGVTETQRVFHMFAVNITGFIMCFFNAKADRIRFVLEEELKIQKSQSEEVLNRILPSAVVDRVQRGEELIADYLPEVSVLFADIVGFTEMAAKLRASQVVEFLNELFAAFDHAAEQHGVEKIKTIGDAYMAAAGCTVRDYEHAEKIAGFALTMLEVIRQMNHKHDSNINIRIGIHSGAVIAGVIGHKRFGYDLWGDTVNVASRMESTALVGSIQVSPETKNLIQEKFILDDPRTIEAKGKGELTVWRLRGAKRLESSTAGTEPAKKVA